MMSQQSQFKLSQVIKKDDMFSQNLSTLKILIATDNHIGFRENDQIRGTDSIQAFEEVLSIAKQEKVDFLLLGGDLFHDNNPSLKCLYETVNLLGKYVLGDGEINFEMPNYEANFHDCNLNIELPIFIIHGNHDFPSHEHGDLSVIDLLHTSKYLNHFGKFSNLETIHVKPIIFEKNKTVIALYGVGYIKDRYFHKLLEENKITFMKPTELGFHNTVNILVIHQNRYKGNKNGGSYRNCVHPQQFPSWIHLIIRGHEVKRFPQFLIMHDQVDDISEIAGCQIQVIQPGSTVATSLIPGESTPRRSILLEINGQCANYQDILLIQSYRPILYESIDLNSFLSTAGFNIEEILPTDQEIVLALSKYVDQSIERFKLLLIKNFPECQSLINKKYSLRFKVEHSGFELPNIHSIEQRLSLQIANPGEVFLLWRRKIITLNQTLISQNPKIQKDFITTLYNKEDFDTIGNNTANEVQKIYQMRISQKKNIVCIPSSLILHSMDTPNQKNKGAIIEAILQELQEKLQKSMAGQQEKEISKINDDFKQQIQLNLQRIQQRLNSNYNNQSIIEPASNEYKKQLFRAKIFTQLEDLKSNITDRIKEQVSIIYKDKFKNNEENSDEIENQEQEFARTNKQKNIIINLSSQIQVEESQMENKQINEKLQNSMVHKNTVSFADFVNNDQMAGQKIFTEMQSEESDNDSECDLQLEEDTSRSLGNLIYHIPNISSIQKDSNILSTTFLKILPENRKIPPINKKTPIIVTETQKSRGIKPQTFCDVNSYFSKNIDKQKK